MVLPLNNTIKYDMIVCPWTWRRLGLGLGLGLGYGLGLGQLELRRCFLGCLELVGQLAGSTLVNSVDTLITSFQCRHREVRQPARRIIRLLLRVNTYIALRGRKPSAAGINVDSANRDLTEEKADLPF